MTDETASAPAEGEALPASNTKPANAGFFSRAEEVIASDALSRMHETDRLNLTAAIERWYAAHYHAAALAGTAPISADDKAALILHVADAVAPAATQE